MTVVPALERIEALDTAVLEAAGVAMALRDVTRIERYLAGVKVALVHRAASLAAHGRGAPVADTVKRGCHTSSGEAAKIEQAARTAAAVPVLNDALSAGTIGIEHLNAYGTVERTLTDDDHKARLRTALPSLLDDVAMQSPEAFRRAVSAEARQIRTDDGECVAAQQRHQRSTTFGTSRADGMGWLNARFDPETASRVFAHLSTERDRLRHADPTLSIEQATADALTNLILGAGRSTAPGVVEVVVFIDLESLLHGAHASGASFLSSGAHLPVSHVRRLCCEARILPMVLNGEGRPLDVGRGQRLANREQRRALRKLHGTCAFPDCHVAFDDCHIHHVQPFERLGNTDLVNLAPLCSRHHHLVHEGGWRLTISADRTICIHRPDGARYATIRWQPPDAEHPRQSPDTLTRRRTDRPSGPPPSGSSAPGSSAPGSSAPGSSAPGSSPDCAGPCPGEPRHAAA